MQSHVTKRFGHANYFILFDTETKRADAYENTEEGHIHENFQQFLEKGVQAFIVGNIGPHAFEILNISGSKIYLARKMVIQEAVDKFIKGELKELNEPTAKRSIGHIS